MAELTKRCEYAVSVSLLRHGLTRLDGSPATEVRCDRPALGVSGGRHYCREHLESYGGGLMAKDYGEQIEKHFRDGHASPEDWAKFRRLCETGSGEVDYYQDFADVVEPHVFGERAECPECGSLVLPGLLCWGCDEWTALEDYEHN